MAWALPMFPLGSVLLPGEALPLHVFEPRYRRMVEECLAAPDGPRFGVVLIARGHEVGGGDERHDVGVVARIVQHQLAADGRYALLCVGEERIRVQAWLPDDPFPLAAVERLPDGAADVAACSSQLASVLDGLDDAHLLLGQLAARMGRPAPAASAAATELRAAGFTTDVDLSAATYALASGAPLGPSDRLRVLAAPDAHRRLAVLSDALEDTNAALRFRLGTDPPPFDDRPTP